MFKLSYFKVEVGFFLPLQIYQSMYMNIMRTKLSKSWANIWKHFLIVLSAMLRLILIARWALFLRRLAMKRGFMLSISKLRIDNFGFRHQFRDQNGTFCYYTLTIVKWSEETKWVHNEFLHICATFVATFEGRNREDKINWNCGKMCVVCVKLSEIMIYFQGSAGLI